MEFWGLGTMITQLLCTTRAYSGGNSRCDRIEILLRYGAQLLCQIGLSFATYRSREGKQCQRARFVLRSSREGELLEQHTMKCTLFHLFFDAEYQMVWGTKTRGNDISFAAILRIIDVDADVSSSPDFPTPLHAVCTAAGSEAVAVAEVLLRRQHPDRLQIRFWPHLVSLSKHEEFWNCETMALSSSTQTCNQHPLLWRLRSAKWTAHLPW